MTDNNGKALREAKSEIDLVRMVRGKDMADWSRSERALAALVDEIEAAPVEAVMLVGGPDHRDFLTIELGKWQQGSWIRDGSNGGRGRPDTFPGWDFIVDEMIGQQERELAELEGDASIDAAIQEQKNG